MTMAEGEGSLRLFPGPKLRGISNSYSYVLQSIVCMLSGNIFPTITLHHKVCFCCFREYNLSVQSLISFLLLLRRSWKHLLFVNLVIQLFLFEPDLFFLSGRLCLNKVALLLVSGIRMSGCASSDLSKIVYSH